MLQNYKTFLTKEHEYLMLREFHYKDDVQSVLKLEQDLFEEPFTRHQLYFLHKKYPSPMSFVIEKDGVIISYIIVGQEEKRIHVYTIGTHRDYQHQGYAKQLLAHLIHSIQDTGITDVFLEVRVNNQPAITLYKKIGFIKIEHSLDYYAPGEHAFIMQYTL